MASSRQDIFSFQRNCSKNSSTYLMRYYATMSWDEDYDSMNNLTASNFRVSWERTATDNNYTATCNSEQGKTSPGDCIQTCFIAVATAVNSGVYLHKGEWNSAYTYSAGSLGSWSVPGSVTVSPGGSTTVKLCQGGACTVRVGSVTIKNSRSTPTPTRPSLDPEAIAPANSYSSLTFYGNCSYGYCPSGQSNSASYSVTDSSGKVLRSGSGCTATVSGLQPNSKYRAEFSVSNGCLSRSGAVTVTTVPANQLSDPTSTSYDTGSVRLIPLLGENALSGVTHKIEIVKCGYNNWTQAATSTATVPTTIELTGLEPETCYEVRAISSSGAGSYTGNVVKFTTSKKGVCQAFITSIEPALDPTTFEATADVCINWETNQTPATITPYYRVKDGYDTTWYEGEPITATQETGSTCFTLHDLFPNQTVYEIYLATHTKDNDWEGDTSEFITPVLPEPDIQNCDSFRYLIDLLCQAVTALYKGNPSVYANPYTKSECDPYNVSPTTLTLWSRCLRLYHAMLCLVCDMGAGNLMNSKPDQYLTAESGWQDFLQTVSEKDTDSWKLVFSGGIRKYIDDKLHSVWHFHDSVDYLVNTLADLSEEAFASATSAIVATENKVYVKQNGSWVAATEDVQPDDFAVYHVNYASNTDFGRVPAGSAYYYWQGTWNSLDANIEELAKVVEELYNKPLDAVTSENAVGQQIKIVDKDYDFERGPSNTIYFVAGDSTPEVVYRYLTLVDDDGILLRNQRVVDGAKAYLYTPEKAGHTFLGWYSGDTKYNSGFIPTYDMTLEARWQPTKVTVSFDLGGASGTAPDPITVNWGDTITLPSDDDIEYVGKKFAGWGLKAGSSLTSSGVIQWTETLPVTKDIKLVAQWDADWIRVGIWPQNGDDGYYVYIKSGDILAKPIDPIPRSEYTFTGWRSSLDEEDYDFTQPVTQSFDLYAQYQWDYVNVWFETYNCPEYLPDDQRPQSQKVLRGDKVTMPTPPESANYTVTAWTLNGTGWDFSQPAVTDLDLQAVWTRAYGVEFDTNGGNPSEIPAQRVLENQYASEPTPPTKEGCTFKGWEVVETVTVTFNPNNGGQPIVKSVPKGRKVTPPDVTNSDPDCQFEGWKEQE